MKQGAGSHLHSLLFRREVGLSLGCILVGFSNVASRFYFAVVFWIFWGLAMRMVRWQFIIYIFLYSFVYRTLILLSTLLIYPDGGRYSR